MPRDRMTAIYESAAGCLVECYVPAAPQAQILDGLEKLAIGSTIAEAIRPASRGRVRFEYVDSEKHAVLSAAIAAKPGQRGRCSST